MKPFQALGACFRPQEAKCRAVKNTILIFIFFYTELILMLVDIYAFSLKVAGLCDILYRNNDSSTL